MIPRMVISSRISRAMLLLLPFTFASSFFYLPKAVKATQQRLLSDSLTQLPLVIWHGLGDSYDAAGIQDVAKLANETNPQTFVHVIRLGDDGRADRSATFFGNLTEQLSQVCDQLANHPILGNVEAVNALGFSQGGQFLRAYVERCNKPAVSTLVTFGAQHNGIAEFQQCDGGDWVCKSANALLRSGTWSNFVQSRLVPAQYFRNPDELDAYLESSNFLADVNNERETKNLAYKQNLASLDQFVMYLFKNDTTVVPKESGWFAEVNTTTEKVTPLKERRLYKEDWLGLKALDERGGLIFDTVEGPHMQLDEQHLRSMFERYLGPSPRRKEGSRRLSQSVLPFQVDL